MTVEDRVRAMLMSKELLLLRGRGPIALEVDQFAAFQLIGSLQLAWRHPGLSPSLRSTIEDFGRQLQRAFDGPDTPQLALTLEQGWHAEYDRERGGS
jgi:hypothetical protein